MISANVTPGSNDYYKVELINPDSPGESLVVHGLQEVYRVLYFKNRNYIASKLLAWVHQRKHALANNEIKISEIILLQNALEHYQYTSYKLLCGFVRRNAKRFKWIAPPQDSRVYPHFEKHILPILEFCSEKEDRNKETSAQDRSYTNY